MTEIEQLIKAGNKAIKKWKRRKHEEICPLTNRTWQEVLDGREAPTIRWNNP